MERGITLGLVEDDQALRQGLERLLGAQGRVVTGTAGDLPDGRRLVRDREPDVIVVDVSPGHESGIELTRELLAECPERRIVLYVGPRLRPALRSEGATQRTPVLSVREREIIQYLAEGLTGDEVAERLVLSAETVKTHIRNAMTKLEARNRVHAIAIALRGGLISLDAGVATVR